MKSLVELFCDVDDYCQVFIPELEKHLLATGTIQRRRARSLYVSEVMTILIHFHQSHYRDFKAYYCEHVRVYLRSEFPGLVSYSRFIDSPPLAVCHNLRIQQHKVFADLAQRGKSSTGWFFGFKLHLVVNDQGDLLDLALTPGYVRI